MAFNPFRKKSGTPTISITPDQLFFTTDFIQSFLSQGITAKDAKFLELYLTVPELQAVINYKARVFSDMRIKAVDKNGDEKDVPPIGILSQPNPLQNYKEFAMQYHVLRSIFGNAFIHPVFGTNPKNTQTLWNLPPVNAEVLPTEAIDKGQIRLFDQTEAEEIIKGYRFEYKDGTITYPANEIIHFNDNQVRFKDDKFLLGDSKIRPMQQACENIKNAYEARGILIQNSALGILTNDSKDAVTGTLPINPKDQEQLQADFKTKYGLSKQKWQLIITNMALRWQSMATDTGKLKLFEEVDSDYRTIAAAYSFPPELLQPKSGTSLNQESKDESLRQLYQDATIPEADEFLQGLTNFLQLENVFFKADFSHIPVLQANLTLRSKAMQLASLGLEKALTAGIISEADATEQFKKYLL